MSEDNAHYKKERKIMSCQKVFGALTQGGKSHDGVQTVVVAVLAADESVDWAVMGWRAQTTAAEQTKGIDRNNSFERDISEPMLGQRTVCM